MKINTGFILREVAGNNLVVPTGEAAIDFNGMMTLNDVGVFLWKKLENGASEDELIAALLAEYEVSESVARDDTQAFIKQMREAGILG